ncbi:MAG: inositol monophosphatase [Alphaproteobacteria bacterium]|nr:inositol monophosphatase [Alphaproteobacteria bacterium]
MKQSLSANLNVMIKAANKASRNLLRDFGEVEHLQISKKGPSDFVSKADLKSEQILVGELQKARPKIGFLLEEGEEIIGEDPNSRWIIDPLDGTTNFLHGIPHFAISIALEINKQIEAAIVYNPAYDELFYAEKGKGAFVSAGHRDRRLRVSARKDLSECLIATGIPWQGRGDHPEYLKQLESVMAKTAGVRRNGAASLDLAYVAAGRCDGFWEMELKPWDIAAGLLLVKEAGGHVVKIGEKRSNNEHEIITSGNILAANSNIQYTLEKLIKT